MPESPSKVSTPWVNVEVRRVRAKVRVGVGKKRVRAKVRVRVGKRRVRAKVRVRVKSAPPG